MGNPIKLAKHIVSLKINKHNQIDLRKDTSMHQVQSILVSEEDETIFDASQEESSESIEDNSSRRRKPRRTNTTAAGTADVVSGKNSMKRGPLKVTVVKDRRYIRMPNFTKRQVEILKEWLLENLENPYPGNKDKEILS